jgi:hypothetical protein
VATGAKAARFLGLWVRIPLIACLSVVCSQVEVPATARSLVQRVPTEGVNVCVCVRAL